MMTPCSGSPSRCLQFPFVPHPLLRGGHLQTLAGNWFPGGRHAYHAVQHHVRLDDGDTVVLHDDCSEGWRPGDRAALLVHGLAGCHLSPYMRRIAGKLHAADVRAFRMDLRGCGAGRGLARLPYHAGRSHDALTALRRIAGLCPGSPLGIAGFSLGGNLVLKLLGEEPDALPAALDTAVAVSPAIDLAACLDGLRGWHGRLYDRHFVSRLCRELRTSPTAVRDAPLLALGRRPRGLRDFDELYTAPACGFGTAEVYYARSSAAQFVGDIRVPTVILAARDDPLIPARLFESLSPSPAVSILLTEHGGHLGYVGRSGRDPDRRWMDWRVVEWLQPANPVHRPNEPTVRQAFQPDASANPVHRPNEPAGVCPKTRRAFPGD